MSGVLIGVPVALVLLTLIVTAGLYIGILVCKIARQQERMWEIPLGTGKSIGLSSTLEEAIGGYIEEGTWREGRVPEYYSFEDVDEDTTMCTDGEGAMSSTIEASIGEYVVEGEREGEGEGERKGPDYYSFEDVDEETSMYTGGTGGPYQGLEQKSRDYTNVYNRLGRGSYQDLDSLGQEEEHGYQRIAGKKPRDSGRE